MDFKKTTDELLISATLEDLAKALGVSVQAIRQARADETSTAHRAPPKGWEKAVLRLAMSRAQRFQRLADRIRAATASN